MNRLALFLVVSALAFWACQLTQNGTTVDTVSFTKLYDSLSVYDSVEIVFKDRDGAVLDTVYRGKVDTHAEIEKLPVKNWDGGPVVITIIGFNAGIPVYKVEKRFDGATNLTDTTFIILVPGITLSTPALALQMLEGDSIPLPPITIAPATLSNKSLLWSSSQPEAVLIRGGFLKAGKAGVSLVTAKLLVDSTRSLTLQVTVMADGRIPDSVLISPKIISLATSGAPIRATVRVTPSSASNAVTWRIADSTIATVSPEGLVQGLKPGSTEIRAISTAKPSIFDTASVVVTEPVLVDSIRFPRRSLDLFVGGTAESLFVTVTPALANPAVDFQTRDSAFVSLVSNRLTGIAPGKAVVIAISRENPAKTDTLLVNVLAVLRLDSVRVKHPTLPFYTGGERLSLTAQVYPATAPQQIKWRSASTGIAEIDAAGKVTAVSPGRVKIHAISQIDSTRQDSVEVTVKRDMPQVSVGADTTISVGRSVTFRPTVTQEYGLVALYQWDLDGNGTWDGSSDSILTKTFRYDSDTTYPARFRIMDSEGNDTVVIKKVKAVRGPVVLIQFPLNNSYTNRSSIKVKWTVDDVAQDSAPEYLKEGANVITRSAKDAAGNYFWASITVYLDTSPPGQPLVRGPAMIASGLPTWTWATGGGGSGSYRVALDAEDFTAAAELKDTAYAPPTNLSEAVHTLFVQERDAAGNWSASGRWEILVDRTAPGKPDVRLNTPAVTKERKPVWTWAGGGGGSGAFQYRIDDGDFTGPGVISTKDTSFTSSTDMGAGPHTFFVRERDAAGNWSAAGSAQVTIDITAPIAPKIMGASPTNLLPRWTWSTGGGAGSGDFRFRLVDANFPMGAPETRDTAYTLPSAATGTTYTLFVQERDTAGNWSPAASLPIAYDLTKPVVTISAPIASGTYYDTLPTVSLAGTSGGPNAISKISYAVDGGTAVDAVLGAGGAWSIPSLAVADGKTTSVTVSATDVVGNTGSATLSILRDNGWPTAPASLSLGTTPTNIATGSWTWSAGTDGVIGSGLNGAYRYALNGGAWKPTSNASVANLPLIEGNNTFAVQEQDRAGNWSLSATNSVTLDTKAPDSVTFAGTDKTFTTNRKPIWTWNPSSTNPGIGVYVLAISAGPDAGTPWDVSANTWMPDLDLADGSYRLTVRQKDQVAGVLGAPRSFTYYVDGTAPTITVSGYANGSTAPTLTGGNTVTLTGSIADNAGGSGIASATYELSGGTTQAATDIANLGAFSITTPPMKNRAATTVTLKTRDAANNPQQTYTIQFNIDVKAPTIEIIQAPVDSFVTSAGTVTLKYSLNGAATTIEDFPLVEPAGPDQAAPTTKVFTASNAIGETVTTSRTFYKAHASVRFFSPSGGTGDCASWITACAFDSTSLSGKENLNLWLLTGNYAATGITLPRGSRLFGQLKPTSKSVTERSDVAVTTLSVSFVPLLFKAPTPVTDTRATSLNYVKITGSSEGSILSASGYFQTGESLVFDHCLFDGISSTSSSSGAALSAGTFNLAFDFIDSQFRNIYSDVAAVQVQGSNQVNFTRCGFNGDRAFYDVLVQYGGSLKFIECIPTQPTSDPPTTCTGTTCTSQ